MDDLEKIHDLEDRLKALEAKERLSHLVGWELGYQRGWKDAKELPKKRTFPWNFMRKS